MCVWMDGCLCIVHMYVYDGMYVCMSVVTVRVCVCVCAAYMCTGVHICMCVHMCMRVYVCTYV